MNSVSPDPKADRGNRDVTTLQSHLQLQQGQHDASHNSPAMERKGRSGHELEIEHLYLNFDTPLPTPAGLSSAQQDQPPPKCPDLKKYTSPFLWPKSRKSVITLISCGVTALAAYAAGEYTPAADELTEKWGISEVVYNLGITLFTVGFGIAPMVLAPFSEINGRRPIFVLSGLLFTGRFSLSKLEDENANDVSMSNWMRCHRFLCRTARREILPRCWRLDVFDNGRRRHQ